MDQLTIDKVKSAANVVDVIGDFYSLTRDGVNMTCLCPFHQDRHIGSFKVSETKNIYTCYSCGAHGGPVDFLMAHEHMKFLDAIKWLGAKYGIEVEDAEKYRELVKQCKPHKPAPPLPMLVLPYNYVAATQQPQYFAANNLVKWLWSLPWGKEQKARLPKMIKNYRIGCNSRGMTVFWQIDEQGQVRTGKMMLYRPDGHRDRTASYNFDYIHASLIRAHFVDPMQVEAVTCYFGQHLIDLVPDADICIVESEKTALVCAVAYGGMKQRLWIASGGLNFINSEKLKPFIERKRHIILFPDHDGIEAWRAKAKAIGYEHLTVDTRIITQMWTAEDGEKADIADIIVRLLTPKISILDKMAAGNETVQELMNKFDLEICGPIKTIQKCKTTKNSK